jgi:hypothetical protein
VGTDAEERFESFLQDVRRACGFGGENALERERERGEAAIVGR